MAPCTHRMQIVTLAVTEQEPYCSQLEAMIVAHVIPAFRSPHGHLRAKACWVAGEYASIRWAWLKSILLPCCLHRSQHA